MEWPAIRPIVTERLRLDVLTVEHATSMLEVLGHDVLYEYTGGRAPTLTELRDRYRAQTIGHSCDQSQWWLNWVVTLAESALLIGDVQATVERTPAGPEASIAWVVTPAFQGRGLATEASLAMVDWLRAMDVEHLVALIHPTHSASQAVARKLGLHATSVIDEGEVRWMSQEVAHAHL